MLREDIYLKQGKSRKRRCYRSGEEKRHPLEAKPKILLLKGDRPVEEKQMCKRKKREGENS